MSEPLRTEHAPAGPALGSDRDARIEQLLLAGLDHYFARDYEQAINVWTRVAFIERGHGRARAYIERARSALAERQRESEELLHKGVAAYHAGELDTARALLTQAVDEGGPSDTALVFLQRLSRLDGLPHAAGAATPLIAANVAAVPDRPSNRANVNWAWTALASAALAAAILIGSRPIVSWIAEMPLGGPAVPPRAAEPLPIARPSDIIVDRARSLYSGGHLRDALHLLERIDLADPRRTEADRLRADVQRALLAASGAIPVAEAGARP